LHCRRKKHTSGSLMKDIIRPRSGDATPIKAITLKRQPALH
jgi:hypothetical protein